MQDKADILVNPSVYKGLIGGLELSVVCVLGIGVVGFLVGCAIVRRRGAKLSSFMKSLTFIPYLVPAVISSIIYPSLLAVKGGPIPSLYGTFALLATIDSVKCMPMASRSGIDSML